jgi:anti-sigma regulatory factor (Ser/Thr protein kinase)
VHATAASFRGELAAVSQMRRWLRRALNRCPAADDVLLCASELAGNAVLHSNTRKPGGTFSVRAEVSPDEYVRIEVMDDGGHWRERASQTGGGRGLMIVAALASDWGIREAGSSSRTVWARFNW